MPLNWTIYSIAVLFLFCMICELSILYTSLSTHKIGMIIQHIYANSTIQSEGRLSERDRGPVKLKEFGLYERNRLCIIFYDI